jgi:hypothetical protein
MTNDEAVALGVQGDGGVPVGRRRAGRRRQTRKSWPAALERGGRRRAGQAHASRKAATDTRPANCGRRAGPLGPGASRGVCPGGAAH